jgi:hypothetical protein
MSDPAYLVFGIDPDAVCRPDFFGLHEMISLTDGNLIADFPSSGFSAGFEWKKSVVKIAASRCKNKKITDDQFKRIEGWLNRNIVDYMMLPPNQDPRFAAVDCNWIPEWGWPRNAANSLSEEVAAVVTAHECDPTWKTNSKWRRLLLSESMSDCVPELNKDNRGKMVCRDASSLASLVAHPLQYGNRLKMIDPYADYEGWHPTLDAMLKSAKHRLSIELHCAREVPNKRPHGPSDGNRKAWEDWAKSHQNLHRLHVFYWNISDKSVLENHDRYAIVAGDLAGKSVPFTGIGVGKGWDPAPYSKRKVETWVSHVSRKDQRKLWDHYSDQSVTLKRDSREDVLWPSKDFRIPHLNSNE